MNPYVFLKRRVAGPLVRRSLAMALRLTSPDRERFDCPICGYQGPFLDVPSGIAGAQRFHAQCPCGSLERHRLQWTVLKHLPITHGKLRVLHFAPENWSMGRFPKMFKSYETADIAMAGVDFRADLTEMKEFADGSYDLIYASHVLEHIPSHDIAIKNIVRLLAPGGLAILPVPIVATKTVFYPAPSPTEGGHCVAPGTDYFDIYRKHFSRVDVFSSTDYDPKLQTFIYEDCTIYPNPAAPLRPRMDGTRHRDYVPVCWK